MRLGLSSSACSVAVVILTLCSVNVMFLSEVGVGQTGERSPAGHGQDDFRMPIVNATHQRSQFASGGMRLPMRSSLIPKESVPRREVINLDSSRTVIANNTSNMEYPDVCFYGSTRFFFSRQTTKSFVTNFLTVLRDISLRSFNEALIAKKNKIHVLVPISSYEPHFQSVDDVIKYLRPVVDTYTNLDVTFSPNAHRIAKRRFSKTDCKWVVITKLDADDVIFPGFLDWIVQKIIPTLDRGAVVGGQFMNRLIVGYGLCMLKTNVGPFHWPGEAMAQTRVIRRDVFERLSNPFEAPPHTSALSSLRRDVFKLFFAGEPIPLPLVRKTNGDRLRYSEEKLWDARMENVTGIRMVEPSLASEPFGPPSLYLKSPLSSHFLYENIAIMPHCTDAEWASVWEKATLQNAMKSNMDYIHKTLQSLPFSVYDACKSHSFFSDYFGSSNLAWFGNATTCEAMEAKVRQGLKAKQDMDGLVRFLPSEP